MKQFQTVAIHHKSVNVRYMCGYMLSHFRNQRTIWIWSWTKKKMFLHTPVSPNIPEMEGIAYNMTLGQGTWGLRNKGGHPFPVRG